MSQQQITLSGYMPPGREKFYHSVPFEMPPGVSRLDVQYSYSDPIGSDPHLTGGNTVDIGLFDWRGDEFLNGGFRGWSGSTRTEFFITPIEATPGYLPGPLTSGTWYVTLGFYKVGPDGCHYTIDLTFELAEVPVSDFPPLFTLDSPNASIPARSNGWYRGELHCHTVHSDGDSRPTELIAVAAGLGLDFLAITDHNNITHLVEQATLDIQPLILIPGYEVTTYHGHWNVWGPEQWVDFRIITPDDLRQALAFATEQVFLVSCNHPRPFGPPWEYTEVTGYQCVEVWNGPWRLFNMESLAFWEAHLRQGERLVAVGGSDMHRLQIQHHAQIGTPTTWIHCPGEPTARGLLAGLRAGHAFISEAPDGPQLYLTAGRAMMGDRVTRPESGKLDIQVRVVGGSGSELQLIGANGSLHTTGIDQYEQQISLSLPVTDTPYVRAQLLDSNEEDHIIRALTNPLYLG